jgi:hypothetical protein
LNVFVFSRRFVSGSLERNPVKTSVKALNNLPAVFVKSRPK